VTAAAAVYMTLLKMRKERPIGLSFERDVFEESNKSNV
jgi:hypothetical protein